MGRLRFSWLAAGLSALAFFVCACGGGHKAAPVSPFAARITLTPSPSFSMQVGSTLQLIASAQNGSSQTVAAAFTFASSNSGILDVAPNGAACAGTWNAPTYSICTPAGIGVAQVTASALGATSPATLFFVHAPIDNIQISVVPPVNSPPPACPTQQALPAACNLKFNPDAANFCLSQNQVETLQARAFSQGTDITASVGPFTWTQVNGTVVKTAPVIDTSINVATNQISVSPNVPGQTQLVASAAGVFSEPYNVETCLVACIAMEVGTNNSGATSFSVSKGTGETITATAVDVQGCIVPKPPLTWTSSAPAAITAGSASSGCGVGSTCALSTTQPGTAAITASCSPPTCNIGFPLNPAANPSPYIPQPVYPVTSISGLVTGDSVATSVLATSHDCSADPLCQVAIYSVSTSTNVPSGAAQLPTPPNSLIFDPPGDRAYMGSQFGALLINPGNIGGTTSPFTSLPVSGTPLGLVTGKILAVSQNGNMAIFSDTVSTPNQVYVVTSSSGAVALNISGATAAAFSPDDLKAFILGDGGKSLFVFSNLQALSPPISLPATATAVVFNSSGSFALLSGGSSSGNLAAYNTCDNSPVPGLSSGALTTPPLFLKMVPAGDVPMGGTFGNIVIPPLQTAGLDFFFGLDNTGIDIIATNTSLLPLPLPPPPLSITSLCPRPVVLAQTAASPASTFPPVHINIGQGTFHPIAFFLSPDSTRAYIITSDFGILIYDFNTGSVSAIPLVNNAVPVAADITVDGTLIYVAGSDGLLHELSTALEIDQTQILFPALPNSSSSFCYTGTNCQLNVVAVKP